MENEMTQKEWRPKRFWMFPLFGLLFLGVGSAAVMLLWNFVMPDIWLGAARIDYWHAMGLLVLCRILFGGFHKGPHKQHDWKHGGGPWNGGPPWGRQWRNMSEEERLKFREEWKKRRCGPWGASDEVKREE